MKKLEGISGHGVWKGTAIKTHEKHIFCAGNKFKPECGDRAENRESNNSSVSFPSNVLNNRELLYTALLIAGTVYR